MAGVNKVILIGHLGADPESKRLNNGDTVVNLRVATSESWRDKASGERKEKTEWHSVVIWNEGLAKVAEQYLAKGSKVYIEGKLSTRSWEDRDGQKRYTTEVVLERYRGELVMLDGKGDGDRGSGGRSSGGGDGGGRRDDRAGGRDGGGSGRGGRTASRDMDDEIPFAMEWRG